MDVLEHLTKEHRETEKLIAKLDDTDPGAERDRLVKELSDSLATHMAVEEQFIYPLAVEIMGPEAATEGEIEHDLARTGLAQLDELRHEPGFGAALEMIKAGIAHHVEEEEDDVFPQLRKEAEDRVAKLDPERLEAYVKRQGNDGAPTKDKLYGQAQDADVSGRSTMSKQELAEAVADDS